MTIGANFSRSVVTAGYYLQTDRTTGVTTKIGFGSDTTSQTSRTVSSNVTSNFATRKRKGNLPINPYSKSTFERYDPLFPTLDTWQSSGILSREYHRSVMGSWCNATARFTSAESANADDPTQKVVSRLFDEIRLGKTNSLVTMAEAHKTAALVVNSATKIYTAIRALRSLHFGDFARALTLQGKSDARGFRSPPRGRSGAGMSQDWLANTWLEYSYGWKPLLNDVYSSAEALSKYMTEYSNVTRCVKSKAKSSRSASFKKSDPVQDYFKEDRHERWVEIGLYYKIPTGQIPAATAFGLNNPLEVVWELVPFSFVADWFIPIGDALRSLTATSGLTFSGGYKTVRELRTTEYGWVGAGRWNPEGGINHSYTGKGRSYITSFSMNRSLLTTWPSYGFPKWKDPRSFLHAASAIALLQSLFLQKK